MATKNKRKRQDMTKRQRKDYRSARRDVRLAYDPVLDEIRRAERQSARELENQQAHAAAIYDALNAQLAPLGGQYDQQVQGISTGLNDALGGLAGVMAPAYNAAGVAPQDMAAAQSVNAGLGAEQVPGLNLFGTIGATGQQLLANDRSRNAAYQTSMQRQSGLDEMAFGRDLLQDYRDVIDDLRQQRIDVTRDIPSQIMQRLDERKQMRFQNRLARDEFGLRETIANKQEKRAGQEARTNNRIQNTVLDQMTDEEKRIRFGNRIQGINKRLPALNQRIAGLEATKPYDSGSDPVHGGLEPNPKLTKFRKRRRNLRQQRKKYRRRKRQL